MEYSIYHLLWFFLVYSFAGWAVGTAVAAVREKKFVDVGFLYGPYCPAYGLGAVAFAVFLPELRNKLFFLFLGGVVLSFGVTLLTGFVLERIFHRKWWDYSRKRFQFGGYVNLPFTVVWGIASVLCISFANPFLKKAISFIPDGVGQIFLIACYVIVGLDLVGTVTGIAAVHSRLRKVFIIEDVSENLQKTADLMGEGLAGWVQRHMAKAYPSLEARELVKARQEKEKKQEEAREKAGVFAVGCSFYKLVCLFFLGAFLGDITETIFCLITTGRLMSRSSVVYGPFSIVWGLGCVLLTSILYQYRSRSDGYIFMFGTVLGGAYEYICSVFTELVFGTVFWDYSDIPFNLGGRINLLYCFFWGIAAVVWMKLIYPRLSVWIEKIPKKPGMIAAWIMIVFMAFNIVISGLALNRYTERHTGSKTEESTVTRFLDEHFTDVRMEKIYPNAILVE
ncbi:MAG: putative ABC transporter permease [Lachnospiraceae bacterium]|nr:putative ABC transporter permease [Lachnospiraceae bacterium]